MNLQKQLIAFILIFGLAANAAWASGTQVWDLAGYEELSRGEAKGTTIHSDGQVTLGDRGRKIDLGDVGLVWSSVRDRRGRTFIGTGYDGRIFQIKNNQPLLVAETGELVVTDLAVDKKGALYAATLPGPIVWKVAKPASAKKGQPAKIVQWATLPKEAQHVWDIEFSRDGRTLFAATGPKGQIFAIGLDGKAHEYVSTKEKHILSLAIDHQGKLLAGTSPSALLLNIEGPGRYRALVDFDGTEVKAIAVNGRTLGLAVNKFKAPPVVPSKSTASKKVKPNGKKKVASAKTKGDGTLYRLYDGVQIEELWKKDKQHIVSAAFGKDGTLYAGLGVNGQIIAVTKASQVSTVLDFDERQVMTLVAGEQLLFAGVGDAGAVYTIESAKPQDASYLSPLLDARHISRWGTLQLHSASDVKVRTRSGNSTKVDKTWSDWSTPVGTEAMVTAPAARFLQLQVQPTNTTSVFRGATVYYGAYNQRPIIRSFGAKSPFKKSSGKNNRSTRTAAVDKLSRTGTKVDLKWEIKNTDRDRLRYRLWYRSIDDTLWRPITKDDEIVTQSKYSWDTASVPAGRYIVKLVADDSLQNDPRDVLSDEQLSAPVLVDNRPPEVTTLNLKGGKIKGQAVDGFSPLADIEYSIDSGSWMPLMPTDGLFDEREESFELTIPKGLSKGPHSISIRASDQLGNVGSKEIHFQTK